MSHYKNPRLRASLITHDPEGRILLLEHTRSHGSYWVLPGGGVDPGETVENAIIREIKEELGLGCTIDRLAVIGELIQKDRHVVDFFFTGTLEMDKPIRLATNEGITDFQWVLTGDPEVEKLLPEEIRKYLKPDFASGVEAVVYLGKYA